MAEKLRRLSIQEASARLKPLRMGEVVEGDEDPHAAAVGFPDDLAVADDGGVAPVAEGRLHAAPLQRDADGVESEVGAEVEIALGVEPPVAGRPAGIAGADASGTFPVMPLVERVAALKLVRGGGNAPEKIVRKRNGDREHRRLQSTGTCKTSTGAAQQEPCGFRRSVRRERRRRDGATFPPMIILCCFELPK